MSKKGSVWVWSPISTAPRDGTQRRFRCANGHSYIGPDVEPQPLSQQDRIDMAREGFWPDHRGWAVTHWRNLRPGEQYRNALWGALKMMTSDMLRK